MSEINVTGLKELQKFLDELPVKVEKNIMRGALRTGARVILDQARQNVPVASGDLLASLRVVSKVAAGQVVSSVKAGGKSRVTGKRVWYAHIIEFTGAVAHTIAAPSNRWLSFGGIFAKSVDHPGMQPHPFMRPALDDKADAAITATAEYIKKRLTKEGINVPDTGITIEDEE